MSNSCCEKCEIMRREVVRLTSPNYRKIVVAAQLGGVNPGFFPPAAVTTSPTTGPQVLVAQRGGIYFITVDLTTAPDPTTFTVYVNGQVVESAVVNTSPGSATFEITVAAEDVVSMSAVSTAVETIVYDTVDTVARFVPFGLRRHEHRHEHHHDLRAA